MLDQFQQNNCMFVSLKYSVNKHVLTQSLQFSKLIYWVSKIQLNNHIHLCTKNKLIYCIYEFKDIRSNSCFLSLILSTIEQSTISKNKSYPKNNKYKIHSIVGIDEKNYPPNRPRAPPKPGTTAYCTTAYIILGIEPMGI
jgi:hypothetical protein